MEIPNQKMIYIYLFENLILENIMMWLEVFVSRIVYMLRLRIVLLYLKCIKFRDIVRVILHVQKMRPSYRRTERLSKLDTDNSR